MLGVRAAEIDRVRAATAKANGNTFVPQSVISTQKMSKSRLGIAVLTRRKACLVAQKRHVKSPPQQLELRFGKRGTIFGLENPIFLSVTLLGKGQKRLMSLKIKAFAPKSVPFIAFSSFLPIKRCRKPSRASRSASAPPRRGSCSPSIRSCRGQQAPPAWDPSEFCRADRSQTSPRSPRCGSHRTP